MVGTQSQGAHGAVVEIRTQSVGHFLRLYGLLQLDDIVATTGEVDALAQSTECEADTKHHNCNAGNGECLAIHRHETEVGTLHKLA